MLGAAQTGLVYLHLTFGNASAIPSVVDHRFSGQAGNDTYQETVAQTAFLAPTELLLSPPLKGSRGARQLPVTAAAIPHAMFARRLRSTGPSSTRNASLSTGSK
jgi:hypothetical protein